SVSPRPRHRIASRRSESPDDGAADPREPDRAAQEVRRAGSPGARVGREGDVPGGGDLRGGGPRRDRRGAGGAAMIIPVICTFCKREGTFDIKLTFIHHRRKCTTCGDMENREWTFDFCGPGCLKEWMYRHLMPDF